MEILTTFILAGGAIIIARIFASTAERITAERSDRLLDFKHWAENALRQIPDLSSIGPLLVALTKRINPEILKTTTEPMPAALVTWIHTWPDQWHVDQQISSAQELYKQYGNWEQVQTVLLQEAKRSELDDDDGILI